MSLSRLLNPKSIAVVGGGAWCENIIGAAHRLGFQGPIIPVHPSGKTIAGLQSVTDLHDITAPIDAAFIGVNRLATIDTVKALSALNAGGAICFASGFSEAIAELSDGDDLQSRLLAAAGDMPVLGPNCYGFLNALDGVGVWPDLHGLEPVDTGVAILTQSSNIAINLTMQTRGLPVAMVITCGNQAQHSQATLAAHLLDDPRITAIGLHIEGFGDLAAWEHLAHKAHAKGVPLVALKVGSSTQAQSATISHTASLAGSHTGALAFLNRLGIAPASCLPVFMEILQIFHTAGALTSTNIASVSCSGGEAALVADTAQHMGLTLPPLSSRQIQNLSAALGPKVALANPLDYHTYIWRDQAAMTAAWSAMAAPHIAMNLIILDYPRPDKCVSPDWDIATDAAIAVRKQTASPTAVVSSLPENLPEAIAHKLRKAGVVPLHGIQDALAAVHAAANIHAPHNIPCAKPDFPDNPAVLSETQAKTNLSKFGLQVPRSIIDTNPPQNITLGFPVVVKGLGHAHKSDMGLVAVGLTNDMQIQAAMDAMPATEFLIEEMVMDGVAELLVGIQHDTAMGLILTLGAGGVQTEVWQDTATCLLPATDEMLKQCLSRLKLHKILQGYRGKPAANIPALIHAIQCICSYALANAPRVAEIEVNPLICTPTGAIAVDALIREAP